MSRPRRQSDSIVSPEAANVRTINTTLDPLTVQQILQQLEDDRKAYQDSLSRTHALLAQVLGAHPSGTEEFSGSVRSARSPRIKPSIPAASLSNTQSHSERERRSTVTTLETFTTLHDSGTGPKTSTLSAEDESDTDEDDALYVQEPLRSEHFDEEGLWKHLREYDWTQAGQAILKDILEDKQLLEHKTLFPTIPHPIPVEDRSHLTHYSIFDVSEDGAPLQLQFANNQKPLSRARDIWRRISNVNADLDRPKKVVGRITIVREPSPLLFAAIHYTLKDYFDVDEMFALLVGDKTKALPHRPWDNDIRHRRTFVFTFEYFTIIGDGCKPMAWQRADEEQDKSETHIPITRCSSVVALSLDGKPLKKVKHRGRRSDIHRKEGEISDPFSSWHVLSLAAYPDWRSTIHSHDSTKHYVNGPEAFLVTLRAEFKDARKRLMEVYHRISALVKTPADFMFKMKVRDKLLFEDDQYTYSRRYFWAYQSLAIMNEDIKEMLIAYRENFDDKFWVGTDKLIWPSDDSLKHRHWRKRMANFRIDIEKEIQGLEEVDRLNDEKMKEIKALRENLFSGTSVMESREAVRQQGITVVQGHNIKVLTLVTIFFLPLTFVTSVFGMTNMPPNDNFVRFGFVTAAICLPTYLVIGSLGSERALQFWKQHIGHYLGAQYYKQRFVRWLGYFRSRPRGTVAKEPAIETEATQDHPLNHPRSQSAQDGFAGRGAAGLFPSGGSLLANPGVVHERQSTLTFDTGSPIDMCSSPVAMKSDTMYSSIERIGATETASNTDTDRRETRWMAWPFNWRAKSGNGENEKEIP